MVRKLIFLLVLSGCSVDMGVGPFYFRSGDALSTPKPRMFFDNGGGVAPELPEIKKDEKLSDLFAPGRGPL